MLETELGRSAEKWTASAKTEFKNDLDKIPKLPMNVLRPLVEKIAKSHPACNPSELVALEAEENNLGNPRDLFDVVSAFVYIWENTVASEPPASIAADLIVVGVLSENVAPILVDLLVSANPFRESAIAQSTYIKIGAPLFVTLRGAVDLRLRFHKTEQDFVTAVAPTGLAGVQQVIVTDLTLRGAGGEKVISFVMDEHDLRYMKRFVKHMERELELSKGLLRKSERETNG